MLSWRREVDRQGDECPISLEPFTATSLVVVLECYHMIEKTAWKKYEESKGSKGLSSGSLACPLCRHACVYALEQWGSFIDPPCACVSLFRSDWGPVPRGFQVQLQAGDIFEVTATDEWLQWLPLTCRIFRSGDWCQWSVTIKSVSSILEDGPSSMKRLYSIEFR